MGLFYPIRIFFHSLKFVNSVLFSPRDHSEIAADAHACERNVWVPTPFPAFSEFITYQIAMENDETNIKVERISLLLARIHRKMEKYFAF